QQFAIDDVKTRTQSVLDQFLMRWIIREGKDMFNLQANAYDIAGGIKEDLDMELIKIGLTVTEFTISNFNYPENIQKMIEKNASYSMVGDMDKYQKIGMVDSMINNPGSGIGSMAQAGAGMAMGIEMAKQMSSTFNNSNSSTVQPVNVVNQNNNQISCISCGIGLNTNSKFCNNCGSKVEIKAPIETKKFCSECGSKLNENSKFCPECGSKA
ncbi:MAG: zinc-ribbon domain-containing protein, partial [Clostridium sp.]